MTTVCCHELKCFWKSLACLFSCYYVMIPVSNTNADDNYFSETEGIQLEICGGTP